MARLAHANCGNPDSLYDVTMTYKVSPVTVDRDISGVDTLTPDPLRDTKTLGEDADPRVGMYWCDTCMTFVSPGGMVEVVPEPGEDVQGDEGAVVVPPA